MLYTYRSYEQHKAQLSQHITINSQESSMLIYTKNMYRYRFRPKLRPIVTLVGSCPCVFIDQVNAYAISTGIS